MCPMRFWLLFFSGIVAGYLAWTSMFFSGGEAAERLVGEGVESVEGESPEECGGGGAKTKKNMKKSWKDWGMFAVDGLSGRYLYVVWRGGAGAPAAASSNVEKKKSFRRNGVGVVDAICKEE